MVMSASTGTASDGNGNWGNTWSPIVADARPWWQVTFARTMSISIVNVAGSYSAWVSTYYLYFLVESSKGQLFYPILEQQSNPQSNLKVIPGARMNDPNNFVPYYLCPNIRTSALRFQPVASNGTGGVAMRFKINGCPPHAPCSTCCTYADGCQCKCPVGYVTNYATSPTNNPWEHCGELMKLSSSSALR